MIQNLAILRRHTVKLYKPHYRRVKRGLEMSLCIIAAPFVIPIALIIAIFVKTTSPGPVLFMQDRVGKAGRHFKIYKFRTMYMNTDQEAHRAFMKEYINGRITQPVGEKEVFKPFQVHQVTWIGRYLRKTSLDELPQLINVWQGEMSLIGPRPNIPSEFLEYKNWHKERIESVTGYN